MSYIALARKWRPRTFSQLVGQDHINKALSNSLNKERLHHAYLFTGTRGVGKTSVARLLAKALNCEKGISAEPCLTCEACVAIEQGRFIDLIEIDGASRTRVEDTRESLDNVQYVPTQGRFKIYLIDEVHMLSQHSFNALLKTLEEPPAHVKFLLATTDPQKLPVTVLSRCLQFNLKPLQEDVIYKHLQHILADEHLSYDKPALTLLAKAAKGSLRDALSLLDQTIASIDDHLHTEDLKNILGYTQQDYALQLLQALAQGDAEQLINLSKQISAEGGHYPYVINEILGYLHQISLCQSLSLQNPLLASTTDIIALSQQFEPEDVQLFYQIAIKGSEELQLAPTLAIGFEMMLLRMYAFRPAPQSPRPALHYENQPSPIKQTPEPMAKQSPPSVVQKEPEPITHTAPQNNAPNNESWGLVVPQLKLSGLTLTAAEHAELVSKSNAEVILRVSKGHLSLYTSAVIKRLEQALTGYYKETIKLKLRSDEAVLSSPAQQRTVAQNKMHEDAEQSLQNDPVFQQLQENFSAELVKNSIISLKDDL
jgi:DNA polymerase-3 subunit gamma/tau